MDILDIKKRGDKHFTERGTFETHWKEVARYFYPESDDFFTKAGATTQGERKNDQIWDSTGVISLQKGAAIFESILIPRQAKYHQLVPKDPRFNSRNVNLVLEQVNDTLFRERYAPRANFAGQATEFIMSVLSFGTGVMFIDEVPGEGVRYKNVFIGDVAFSVDHQGMPNEVWRKVHITYGVVPRQFPDAKLPLKVESKVKNQPDAMCEIIHYVGPDGDQWKSVYYLAECGTELDAGSYRSMPYIIDRYQTSPYENWGRSPAMAALPTMKLLNAMKRDEMRATNLIINPAILMHDDGVLSAGRRKVNIRPGALNPGGVSQDGRQMLQPFNPGARIDLAEQKLQALRMQIEDAFFIPLFQILVQTPRMTATEAMIRANEKAALLAPLAGRQQSEWLGPMIERELDILEAQGKLPRLPNGVDELDIRYDSPLSRIQRSEELSGIQRVLEVTTQAAQFDPSVMSIPDWEFIIRTTAEISGAPVKALKSSEQIQQERQAQDQATAEAQSVEALPQVAGAMKDIAQAQQISQETV